MDAQAVSVGAGGCSGRMSNGTNETAGVRFGCVLADAGYGLSAPFRQGLTARKLTGAVGIPRHLEVCPADVRIIWPVAKRGRPRQRHVPDILSIPAEDMLVGAPSGRAPARKESSRLVLLRPAFGSQTDHRSGSGTRASNICPGTRLGSSANTGCREPPAGPLCGHKSDISRGPRRAKSGLYAPQQNCVNFG